MVSRAITTPLKELDKAVRRLLSQQRIDEALAALRSLVGRIVFTIGEELQEGAMSPDREDYKDVIAQTLYAVWMRFDEKKLELKPRLTPLVATIARRRFVDIFRRKAKQRRILCRYYDEVLDHLPPGTVDDWTVGMVKEILQVVEDVVSSLSGRDKEVAKAMKGILQDDVTSTKVADAVEARTGKRYHVRTVRRAMKRVRELIRRRLEQL